MQPLPAILVGFGRSGDVKQIARQEPSNEAKRKD